MQVGTVRREALRLMFAAYDDMLQENIDRLYENPQYSPYLADMEMCINRAVSRMQSLGLVGMAEHTLSGAVVTGSSATYNLGDIPDFGGVAGLWKTDETGRHAHAYQWAGGTTLVVPRFSPEAIYTLYYRRVITPLQPMCPDTTPIPLPEGLSCLLPYYIKSELYEEEDAIGAARAREYFEAGLAAWPRGESMGAPPIKVCYDL